MTQRSHEPDCTLYSVHWLRHAITAVGKLAAPDTTDPDELAGVDRRSAEMLADTLARFAELPDWETVTLLDVAEQAQPTDEDGRFLGFCSCG